MSIIKKRFTWLATAALSALLLVTSISINPAMAETPPPFPGQTHQFFGIVRVNNAPAIAGTYIYAYLDGGTTAVATTTVDSLGRYGYSPLFFEVPGNGGQTVTFKVGTATAQSHPFVAGASTNWPLSVTTTTLAVSTNAASSIGSSTATLNGNLSNMGGFASVTVSFIYGTTPPYGGTAKAGVPSPAAVAPADFTASLTGLTTNTTYYFVAVATSGTTTVYGVPQQFTTTLPILAVATTAATGTTANGATLNGNLTDPGNNGSVNTYFQYGTTQSYGTTTTTRVKSGATTFNEPITGLIAGTTYNFRAVAVGTSPVETKYGGDLTFTTPAGSLSVTTGNASSISCNGAVLYGTLTGLGGASSASIYFQYGTTTSYTHTTSTQPGTPPGSFSTAISGLAPGVTYHFKAYASTTGTPVSGLDATFTTPSCSGDSGFTPPNQFWGKVYVNGILASSNIPVAAYVNGVPAASTTTDPNGRYGWTTLFYVTPISGSGTVTFYVNGVLVPQTAAFSSGGITNLDLYSAQSALTVTCSAAYAGTTSATLTGTVTSFGPGDTLPAVSFEWGTSASALTTVTASPTAVSAAGQSFTATKTSLTPGATYYYRAKVVGTSGTVYCPASGSNTYIHTSAATVATVNSTCSGTTATLNGNLTGMGPYSSGTVLVSFLWGTSPTLATSTETTPVSRAAVGTFSAPVTIVSGTTYYFRAKAIGNAIGATAVYGDIQTMCSAATVTVATVSSTCNGTTATLNGNLTGMGPYSSGTVLVSFLWGTSSTLATSTETTQESKNAIGTFSAPVTIASGTTYYFRAKAIGNAIGATVVYGDIQTMCSGSVPCGSDPVGCTVGTAWATCGKNSAVFSKYTATADSAGITKINVVSAGSGIARVAIYSDSGTGTIGTLIKANNSDTTLTAGTTTVTIESTPIANGTVYWLAVWTSTATFKLTLETTSTYAYQETSSSFTFPTTMFGTVYYGGGARGLISGN